MSKPSDMLEKFRTMFKSRDMDSGARTRSSESVIARVTGIGREKANGPLGKTVPLAPIGEGGGSLLPPTQPQIQPFKPWSLQSAPPPPPPPVRTEPAPPASGDPAPSETVAAASVPPEPPPAPSKPPEEMCGVTSGMSKDDIRARLALLYRRYNRATSSLDPKLREEADVMLDAIVAVREKAFGPI